MSVQKLFFTMESLSWSWQGTQTVPRLIQSLPGVTGIHPHIDRVTLEFHIHRVVPGGMGCGFAACAVKTTIFREPRDNKLLFPLGWKMVSWETP